MDEPWDYIYIWPIIVVRRWTIHCACQRKCKNESYQKSKKLKAGFFQATWQRMCTCARNVIIPSPTPPHPTHPILVTGERRRLRVYIYTYYISYIHVDEYAWMEGWIDSLC